MPHDPTDPIPSLTVVIPALNEAAEIGATVGSVRGWLPGARLIVVDADSTDDTARLAQAAGAEVVSSARGRGVQCHAGARRATSEWLLFLHADTRLPARAANVIANWTRQPGADVATFRLRFDSAGPFLRACGWCTRIDSVFTRFGDQGILIRRTCYDELGGFPPWPLFEDVALLQRARARGRVHSLPAWVTTSARRFRSRGALRQQWLNARLLLRYLAGVSPVRLAEEYRMSNPRAPAAAALGADVDRPANSDDDPAPSHP